MRAKEFLSESSNTNLLIIDVQPEYHNYSKRILPGIQRMIEQSNGRVVIVFNDFGGGDTPEQVFNYLAGHDEDYDGYVYDDETDDYIPAEQSPLETKLQNAQFIQKEYGFLRGWMDNGVADKIIIEVIRAMYQQRVYDSRDLDPESLSEDAQDILENMSDSIHVQDWVPVTLLKSLQLFYMMGGGRNECLREIELICNAFNIRYKRIDSLIY
jgi:hypothetical protein